jgi:hypothetical protein
VRRKACLDVPEALPVSDLRKSHHLKLRRASKRPHRTVAVITHDNPVERAPWQKIHELREYRLAGVHDQALPHRMVEESRIRDQIHPSNDRAKSVTYQWIMVCLAPHQIRAERLAGKKHHWRRSIACHSRTPWFQTKLGTS